MNLEQLAREAGFYTNGNEIFSPNVRERITDQLQLFLHLVENEILTDLGKEREPRTLNYSTNAKYAETISHAMKRLRS